jgi:hypothetical protein
MSILNTFDLRNLRAAYRQERRLLLKTASQALLQLQTASAGSPVSHHPLGNKDYSDPAVLRQIVETAQETCSNIDKWKKRISELEKSIADAEAAAAVQAFLKTLAVIGFGIIILIVVGYWFFHGH